MQCRRQLWAVFDQVSFGRGADVGCVLKERQLSGQSGRRVARQEQRFFNLANLGKASVLIPAIWRVGPLLWRSRWRSV